jgi:integrase
MVRTTSGARRPFVAGLPVGKLQVLLGHADAATTAIYIRPEATHAASDPRARLSGHEMATLEIDSDSSPN